MIADLLKALESQAQKINGRPGGVGHLLLIAPNPENGKVQADGSVHPDIMGFEVKCAGTPGTDADGNPTLTQHLIGTITKGPTSEDYIAIENPGDAVFTLDPAQTAFDPANPLCFCGKGPVI